MSPDRSARAEIGFRGFVLVLLVVVVATACGAGRPRIRLHGWPDDLDLAEILEQIVDDPKLARSYAPSLVWDHDGQKASVLDPHAELAPFRSVIKEAVAPPRDATPKSLRCDVEHLRCSVNKRGERTAFFFALKGPTEHRYIVLERMETQNP